MELTKSLLDVVLVPLGICLISTYHWHLWRKSLTQTGISSTGRKSWLQKITEEKQMGGEMLGIQSFRNSLMSASLCAMISILMATALGADASNARNAHNALNHSIFGSQSDGILVLKYATCLLLLLVSFSSCSIAIGSINEANFMLIAGGGFLEHGGNLLQRGCALATIGERVFYVAIPFLSWFAGPVAFILVTVFMLWLFYSLDFVTDGRKFRGGL